MLVAPGSAKDEVLSWWPPFFRSVIEVTELRPNLQYAKLTLPLTTTTTAADNNNNNNNHDNDGAHFASSLYTMCDPVYVGLLSSILGREEFAVTVVRTSFCTLQPATSTVTAEITIPDELFASLKSLKPEEKRVWNMEIKIFDDWGQVVARFGQALCSERLKPGAKRHVSSQTLRCCLWCTFRSATCGHLMLFSTISDSA